jgi:signal transduction histidine kinase
VNHMQQRGRAISFIAVQPGLLFGIALSLSLGLLAYQITKRMIENENEERFRGIARTAQYTIDGRIKSYTNMLRAAASQFRADPNVTREKFHRFYLGLEQQQEYPAIVALNFVVALKDADRDQFEARIRREIKLAHEDPSSFSITPPGRRPTYSVITYVEPTPHWVQGTIGRDLDAQPIQRQALADARDSGLLSATGAPIQVMLEKKVLGLAMRMPVYRVGAPTGTVEERRAAHIGSVGIAFSVQRLVQGVLNELPVKPVRLILYNQLQKFGPSPEYSPSQLIYDSMASDTDSLRPQKLNRPDYFHVWLPIDFNGRAWTAYFTAPKKVINTASDSSGPLLAFVAALTSTMLLYGVFYILTSSRTRAIELAKGMTKELRASQEQLLASNEKLRRLAAHAEQIKELERKRIAREIHDDLGQNLLALRIDAQLLAARTGARHRLLHERAEATLLQIDTTIKSVRQIINNLRPNVLDLGLNAAVDWQIAEFRRRTGIRCDLVEYHTDINIDDNSATALFRILQESLTNIRRHALANWVGVDLLVDSGHVRLIIRDNGVGLNKAAHKYGAFGLIGMEERVNMLGGTFSASGTPGSGTIVEVTLPITSPKAGYADGKPASPTEEPASKEPA